MELWLIEDHHDLRESLGNALTQARADWTVRAFATGEDALQAAETSAQPGVILLDLGLPGIGGLELLPRLRQALPGAEVVVFTVFDDAEKIYTAICAGASGYLLKSAPVTAIVRAVEEVLQGGSPMHPQVARKVLDRLSGRSRADAGTLLSEREREVLQRMAEGLTKKEIAAALDLSIHTVDNYLRRIYRKLHVNTLQGAVARALKDGLL
jgi:DNA-binding NarL/FixJ family response regulator